jgi:hypothetical protein
MYWYRLQIKWDYRNNYYTVQSVEQETLGHRSGVTLIYSRNSHEVGVYTDGSVFTIRNNVFTHLVTTITCYQVQTVNYVHKPWNVGL